MSDSGVSDFNAQQEIDGFPLSPPRGYVALHFYVQSGTFWVFIQNDYTAMRSNKGLDLVQHTCSSSDLRKLLSVTRGNIGGSADNLILDQVVRTRNLDLWKCRCSYILQLENRLRELSIHHAKFSGMRNAWEEGGCMVVQYF